MKFKVRGWICSNHLEGFLFAMASSTLVAAPNSVWNCSKFEHVTHNAFSSFRKIPCKWETRESFDLDISCFFFFNCFFRILWDAGRLREGPENLLGSAGKPFSAFQRDRALICFFVCRCFRTWSRNSFRTIEPLPEKPMFIWMPCCLENEWHATHFAFPQTSFWPVFPLIRSDQISKQIESWRNASWNEFQRSMARKWVFRNSKMGFWKNISGVEIFLPRGRQNLLRLEL